MFPLVNSLAPKVVRGASRPGSPPPIFAPNPEGSRAFRMGNGESVRDDALSRAFRMVPREEDFGVRVPGPDGLFSACHASL